MSKNTCEKTNMIAKLLKKWNIGQIDSIEPTPEGGGKTWFINIRSDRNYVLKQSDLVRLEQEYTYQSSLSTMGMPVAVPVKSKQGGWYVECDNQKTCCLYPKLPGQTITEHYTGNAKERAKGYGHAIGLLHTCFLEMDDDNCNREMDLVEHLREWAIPVIRKGKTLVNTSAIERIWEDVEPGLISLCQAVPRQIIHRDAHTSNILLAEGQLTGFLDFEMVTRGQRLFDVCYCGSCILVGGFEEPEKAEKWPAIFQSLIQGYQEHCLLTPSELKHAYEMLVAIELIFTAYWLSKPNADGARQVESLLYWLEKHKDILKI
jgi:Ser/Thr protein kinase RdoA (MazF antagonist)